MEILKGAEVSARMKEQVLDAMKQYEGDPPMLAIVRVGEKPDDLSYERGAMKKMESFGFRARSYAFPEGIPDAEFRNAFQAINADPGVAGILVLLPLPKQIDSSAVAAMIDPKKDLDGISPVNMAKVFAGDASGYAPCTAEAVVEVLKAYEIPISGRRAVIVGRSLVVGKPLSAARRRFWWPRRGKPGCWTAAMWETARS